MAKSLNPFEAINQWCNAENLLQVIATIAALAPENTWLQKAVTSLKTGSSSATHLANLLLNQAQGMALADVFRMEYLAALHCSARSDFAEGIRALLIDKDLKPQ